MVKEKRFYQIKPIDELTFADDFMFGRVMRDKSICKELLEILLGIKIERIEFPEIQKELVAHDARIETAREMLAVCRCQASLNIQVCQLRSCKTSQRKRKSNSCKPQPSCFMLVSSVIFRILSVEAVPRKN